MSNSTTFCDIKTTEDIEDYHYENEEYTWPEGTTVSIPYHTASKLVNKWDQAVFASSPYEVRQDDYDSVLGAQNHKNKDEEVCGVEKSDGEACSREKPCPYHGDEE